MTNLLEFLGNFENLLDAIRPLILLLGSLAFTWGIVKFIYADDDKIKVSEGRSLMIWGILALFIMVSYEPIIKFFASELNFDFGFPKLPPYK